MLGASTSQERKYYLPGTDVKFADVLEGLLNVQDGEFVPLSHAAILATMAAVTHVKVSGVWASSPEKLTLLHGNNKAQTSLCICIVCVAPLLFA